MYIWYISLLSVIYTHSIHAQHVCISVAHRLLKFIIPEYYINKLITFQQHKCCVHDRPDPCAMRYRSGYPRLITYCVMFSPNCIPINLSLSNRV